MRSMMCATLELVQGPLDEVMRAMAAEGVSGFRRWQRDVQWRST
jgi:hypothetical protein